MSSNTFRPFKAPKPLICEADKEITLALVQYYIGVHEGRMPRYRYLGKLYQGFHDIYNQPEKDSWKPDNRLSVNFPKYITDTFMGYAYGIPVKKTHPDEAFQEILLDFDKRNSIDDEDYMLAKYACMYGHAWEYMYQNEEAKTRVKALKPLHCFCVYDDTLRQKAMFGVRYDYKNNNTVYGEFMTPDAIVEFRGNEIIEQKPNPYGKIPLVEFPFNDERTGLYEQIANMVEIENKTLAEKANDVDAFAEAYLTIIGAEVDEEGVYRIRDDRIINLYGTDNAKDVLVNFLTKPTADGTQENLLDRLEKLIYQISMVANISDESFGNSSGTALAYKLQAMSNLALNLDRKMKKSMSKRYKLLCQIPVNSKSVDAYEDIEYTMSRNVPKNLLEEAQTAQQLEGVVSKETQLKVLSIVDNIPDELKKLEEEEKNATPLLDQRFMQPQEEQEQVKSDEQQAILDR